MKIFMIIPLLLASLQSVSQEKEVPSVQFREGKIVWYIPSSGQQFRSLPAYIPGFVSIRQTLFIQKLTNAEVIGRIKEELTALIKTTLTSGQKVEFLEKYACLILLNYLDVVSLPEEFLDVAKDLKSDGDPAIRADAELVVKMYEMYLEERR